MEKVSILKMVAEDLFDILQDYIKVSLLLGNTLSAVLPYTSYFQDFVYMWCLLVGKCLNC